jgi:hypothetical protein
VLCYKYPESYSCADMYKKSLSLYCSHSASFSFFISKNFFFFKACLFIYIFILYACNRYLLAHTHSPRRPPRRLSFHLDHPSFPSRMCCSPSPKPSNHIQAARVVSCCSTPCYMATNFSPLHC